MRLLKKTITILLLAAFFVGSIENVKVINQLELPPTVKNKM